MTAERPRRAARAAPVEWLHSVEHDGALAYRMGRQGQELVAEWPGVGRMTCDADGGRVRVTPRPGMPRPAVVKLRGVVNAMLGDLRGDLGVHAASAAIGSRAVLLMGDNGSGKSTAAAQLCLQHGGRLLSDDAAVLSLGRGVVRVLPSEAVHYLSRESGEALGLRVPRARFDRAWKTTVRPARAARRGVPLSLIVVLRFDDALPGPASARLGGAEAVRRVLGQLFRFDLAHRGDELDRVLRLYEQAPFLDVARPRSQPDVAPLIVRALEEIHAR